MFLRTEDPAPFQEDDLLLAEELVARAALSLDNARRYTRERTRRPRAATQPAPRTLHGRRGGRGGLALPAGRHATHGVGGDWFDVIPLSGARVALVVGDVVGHGINAAATMGRLRTAVRTLADMELPPDELLARLDDLVLRLAEEDADARGRRPPRRWAPPACTPSTTRSPGGAPWRGPGTPRPRSSTRDGRVTFPDLPTGAPLGLGLGCPSSPSRLELPEGSLLALYTDGLVETRDHDIDVGMHRLGTALAQPESLPGRPLLPARRRPSPTRHRPTTSPCSLHGRCLAVSVAGVVRIFRERLGLCQGGAQAADYPLRCRSRGFRSGVVTF